MVKPLYQKGWRVFNFHFSLQYVRWSWEDTRMKRILIIEDDEAIRAGLCRSLASDTMEAVGAEDLASAAQRINAQQFDLLLLDCNLPMATASTSAANSCAE